MRSLQPSISVPCPLRFQDLLGVGRTPSGPSLAGWTGLGGAPLVKGGRRHRAEAAGMKPFTSPASPFARKVLADWYTGCAGRPSLAQTRPLSG